MAPGENKTGRPRSGPDIELLVQELGSLHDAAFLVDRNARFLFANEEACRLTGYGRDELARLGLADLNPDFRAESWNSFKDKVRNSGSMVLEGRLKTRDGSMVPVEVRLNFFEHGGEGYSLTLARDITDLKRREKERLDHLRFFESMDRVDRRIRAAGSLEKMMSDVLDETLSIFDCDRASLLHPCDPDADSWGCPMERSRPEYPGIAGDGSAVPMDPAVAETFRTLLAADGPVRFGPGTGRTVAGNISERSHCRSLLAMALHPKVGKAWQFGIHQCSRPRDWTPEEERLFKEIGRRLTDALTSLLSDRELRESEEKFKSLAESAQDAIIKIDRDGRVRYWNGAAERIFGWSASEIMGQDVHSFLAPERYLEESTKGLLEFRKTGAGPVLGKVVELRALRKDHREIPVELSISGVFLHGSWNAICIARDVTERKKLEEQLLHSQKMDAIGSLAGGVAHDFNNILTAIIGYGNILKMKMRPDDPLLPPVDAILSSSERAAQLTKSLLTFGRKQVIRPVPIDLNRLVRNVEEILKRLIGEDIDFSTRLCDDAPVVTADAGQVEQVLMNLATNARDAMPDGGALSISTRVFEMGEGFVRAHGFGKPGKYARIEVSDTGAGMDEETRKKIFEPFFSTKGPGKGTGLGLAIAYGIVKQHDGFIDVSSEPGKGTTFRIYLPLVGAPGAEPSLSEPPPPSHGGNETILLVEDEEIVRNLTKTVLESKGYRVIDAVDGQDGIEKFSLHGKEIDLLILDVIMPRKSGKEVYQAVKAVRPDMDILFISGYPAEMIGRKGILDDKAQLILKPVSPSELLRKIREILDRRRWAGPSLPPGF
jgi:PAS domain S-box-containing protein